MSAIAESAPAIEICHLTHQVRDADGWLPILHDINLRIAPASTVAIVGASGSGKSTLLSLIAGLDIPSQGTVHIGGHDLFARSEDDRAQLRAQHMGFVFQSFQLLPHRTALENVMLALELHQRPHARTQAQAMLERVGLGTRLHHYPRLLSGGEQQRVALARAFVMQPTILLADEPTGSLDFATGARIMDLMFDLNREHHTTLLLVTHDRTLAARCQRQITLERGRIHADNTTHHATHHVTDSAADNATDNVTHGT